jgi:hypothetical protein
MTATQGFTIKKELAVKYLTTYVADGETEWLNALGSLASKNSNKELVRSIIAATILLPAQDRSVIPEIPYNLLFWIKKYDQFEREDWQRKLQKIIEEDEKISKLRSQLVVLGCIDPIEYAPYTRQALRWLVNSSKEAGDFLPSTDSKFRSLIHVYGGVSISNIFTLHKNKLTRMPNWRSHYFFERAMHDVYDIDQLVRLKKKEIEKTNPSLVNKL